MVSRPLIALLLVSCVVLTVASAASGQSPPTEGKKLHVLVVNGQDQYHHPDELTPVMKQVLEDSGRFTVDAIDAITPDQVRAFHPRFADYDVVLSAYISTDWPEETKREFAQFVRDGGGFVCVHAGNNAFPNWPEYNRMTGLGGWGDRNEKDGPYVYYNDQGKLVRDTSPGGAGHHGPQHEFQIRIRDAEHPITRGLPPLWLHTQDELYDSLRGPAEEMDVLATAWSDPQYQGTGRNEPMLMAIRYGKGRVFHTAMGHAAYSMRDVGFIATLQRGTEWAATGEVTIPVPDDFPTADKTSSRD